MHSTIRNSLLWLSGTRVACATARLLSRLPDSDPFTLRVLTWHRILPTHESDGVYPGVISATPEQFAAQIELLASRYRVVSVDQVLQALCESVPLPPRAVLLTFDDAQTDFARHAAPRLRRLGLPSTLFVPTAYPGNASRVFWWNRIYRHAVTTPRRDAIGLHGTEFPLTTEGERQTTGRRLVKNLRSMPHETVLREVDRLCHELGGDEADGDVLDWDELRGLLPSGVTLAPHTRTHPLLNRVPLDIARSEVLGSIEDLQREIGQSPPVFAYPAGGHCEATARMLADAGILAAFTTQRGVNNLRSTRPQALQRINVGRRATEATLLCQLHSVGWALRNAVRGRAVD